MKILFLLLLSQICFGQDSIPICITTYPPSQGWLIHAVEKRQPSTATNISVRKGMDGTIYTSTVPYNQKTEIIKPTSWSKPFITDNDGWVYALQFNAGLWEGFHDALKYHYWTVSQTFGVWDIELNDQFWRDSLSWKNKYKNWPTDKRERYPGSKSVLVWTTDGEHLTRMISNTSTVISVGISAADFKDYPKKQWLPLALKRILLSAIANKIGFLITYNIIFKP